MSEDPLQYQICKIQFGKDSIDVADFSRTLPKTLFIMGFIRSNSAAEFKSKVPIKMPLDNPLLSTLAIPMIKNHYDAVIFGEHDYILRVEKPLSDKSGGPDEEKRYVIMICDPVNSVFDQETPKLSYPQYNLFF